MLGPNVSHYEVVKKLGEGGMGVVYQARDRSLARFVALKFLNPHLLGSDEQVARFEQEARAISALNHPNIATIHGIEQSDEYRFLVLEYLPGGTLASKLAELKAVNKKLPIEQALDYGIQIAEGLKHAHDHGVIHRDIKASNVMFTEDGRLKITDFGLARLAEELQVTTVGTAMGTPSCMSPEQALGLPVDHRADLFSLGILLYLLFAGEMPFRAPTTPGLMHQIVYERAPALAAFRSGIPSAIEGIVSKALEKDRDQRYQAAGQLLDDLAAVRQGTGQVSVHSRASLETVAVRPLRPRRRRAWAIGVAVLALGCMSSVLMVPKLRERVAEWLPARPLPVEKRVAVLPFTTSDPMNQAFSDGLNDIVSYKLARLEQFKGSLLVLPASLVTSKEATTPRVALERLGANLAISGTVLRTGEHLQAIVSLVDTRNQAQLRSATIETPPEEITTFRDRVVAKVAQMMDLEVTAQALKAQQAGDTSIATAYASYLEGRGYLQRRDRPENLDKAITAFKEAIAKDDKYALAYAGAADAYFRKYDSGKDPIAIKEADANCSRAIDLNDELEPVHITMGLIQAAQGRYERAAEEYKRVLELNPSSAEALRGLADTYESRSLFKEAEQVYKNAIALRPKDWMSHNDLGVFYYNRLHRYEDAERSFRAVTELTPDNPMAFRNLGSTYLKLGRYEEAFAALQKSVTLDPNAGAYSNLGMGYYLKGRYAEAAAMLEKATQLTPDNESYWGNLGHVRRWDPNLTAKAPEAFHRAIDLGTKEIAINPRDADVHARLATYWAALGSKTNSLAEIAEAIQLAPRSGYVFYRAALVYEQAGDRKQALGAVKSALELNYSLEEIQGAVALKDLREDARYRKLLDTRASKGPSSSSQH